MTTRTYEREWPQLYEFTTVPTAMQNAMRVEAENRLIVYLIALAQDLRVGGRERRVQDDRDLTLEAWKVLNRVLGPLASVVEDGQTFVDGRALSIAEAAVSVLEELDPWMVLEQFGWDDARLPSVAVRDLDDALRRLLAKQLAGRINQLLSGWEKKGRIPHAGPRPSSKPTGRPRGRDRHRRGPERAA